jgi:hypothetical protein
MNIHRTTQQPSQWQIATIAAIGFAIVWNYLTNSFPSTGVSIAKLSSTLDSFAWQGAPLSPSMWTLLMMSIGSSLALLLLYIYEDRSFSGVVIWAIGGIIIANLTTPTIALGGLLIIAISGILTIQRSTSI